MALAMKYMYIVHRLVLTISKQQDLHPGHRRYYRPRTKEEEQLSRRIQFTVKSPETRLMSPETYCQVARKAELYMSLQILSCSTTSSSILITHLCACFISMKIREQDIVLIYHACFIVHQGLRARYNYYTLIPLFSSHYRFKERGMLHIHSSCFVSRWFCFFFLWYLFHGSKFLESNHNKIT